MTLKPSLKGMTCVNSPPVYICGSYIFLENEEIVKGSLYLEKGKIKNIYIEEPFIDKKTQERSIVINGENMLAIPGFIDGHIHGANGADVMDATEQAIDTIASYLPEEGTTSFLGTTITQSPQKIEEALRNISQYNSKPGMAELVGVHLEGPFVEKSRAGAQPSEYIVEPDLQLFLKWQEISGGKIKTVTMAPEHDKEGLFIRSLANNGVNVSAGHTTAGFADMKKAAEFGVNQITHLCNAMNGIHHRDVGPIGAAYLLEGLYAELIADGIHVVPEMMQIIFDLIGSSRLMLVTDSMRAKGLPPGQYELGGQRVNVNEGRAVLRDGTLAGSVLKMIDGVRNMLNLDGVTLSDVVKMASVNPAKQIGVFDRKGSISVGKDADILLLDGDWNIKYTITRGEIAFKEIKN